MTEPPEIRLLDFSEFHPTGDHWPFTPYCRTFYGGGRQHIALAWEYRRRDQLLAPWHWWQCRRGHHRMMDGWRRDRLTMDMVAATWCHYCGAPAA